MAAAAVVAAAHPAASLPVQSAVLAAPPLEEVAKALQNGLEKNYKEVSVTVVDCPDLSQQPWGLAAAGLCGQPRLLDIGGVPYLMPLVQRDKLYDMVDYPALTGQTKLLLYFTTNGLDISRGDCIFLGSINLFNMMQ